MSIRKPFQFLEGTLSTCYGPLDSSKVENSLLKSTRSKSTRTASIKSTSHLSEWVMEVDSSVKSLQSVENCLLELFRTATSKLVGVCSLFTTFFHCRKVTVSPQDSYGSNFYGCLAVKLLWSKSYTISTEAPSESLPITLSIALLCDHIKTRTCTCSRDPLYRSGAFVERSEISETFQVFWTVTKLLSKNCTETSKSKESAEEVYKQFISKQADSDQFIG